jgi:hypothetical protein
MTMGPSGPNVIPFPTVDRLAIPDRIERRNQVLEQRNRSNLHFAERSQLPFKQEELLAMARRAINEAYRYRDDGLAVALAVLWVGERCAGRARRMLPAG